MKALCGCLVVTVPIGVPMQAQADEWERAMLVYLLGAGLDGTSQIGPLETEIDQSFGDILEHLDVGGMGSFRASNGTWSHTIDAIYTGLSGEEALASRVHFDVEIDQLIASYHIGYRVAESFEVLAGVRYNSIDLDLGVSTQSGTSQRSRDQDWFDPYVGFRSTISLNDTFAFGLRGDVGGFDVGSKLAWQAVVRLDWNFGETFFATLGYRILDTDYEEGSGLDFFKYDVAMHGPGIGIGWRFR